MNFQSVWNTKSIWKNQSWAPIEWITIVRSHKNYHQITLHIKDKPELGEWQKQGANLTQTLFKHINTHSKIYVELSCEQEPSSEECCAFWRGFWLTMDSITRDMSFQEREVIRVKTPLEVCFNRYHEVCDKERIWAYAVWWVRSLQEAPENQRPLVKFVRWLQHWLRNLDGVSGKIMKNPRELTGLKAFAGGMGGNCYFVDYEYKPRNSSEKQLIGLIGKGVAYDAGGMALKPCKSMKLMKMDYSGGLVAFAVFRTSAYLQQKQPLVCLIPLTLNLMTTPNTLKPSDVIPLLKDKKTIEVVNPDAEGRVLLAEASLYAQKYYPKMHEVILLGTITSQIDKIGHGIYSGLFVKSTNRNEQEIRDAWEISGNAVQEFLWNIPLDSEMKPLLLSNVADYQNVNNTVDADLLWSGLFLSVFWEKRGTWSYIDLGGTMDSPFSQAWAPNTGRGVGVEMVRTYLEC